MCIRDSIYSIHCILQHTVYTLNHTLFTIIHTLNTQYSTTQCTVNTKHAPHSIHYNTHNTLFTLIHTLYIYYTPPHYIPHYAPHYILYTILYHTTRHTILHHTIPPCNIQYTTILYNATYNFIRHWTQHTLTVNILNSMLYTPILCYTFHFYYIHLIYNYATHCLYSSRDFCSTHPSTRK